jgi:hypothetical protein
MSDGHDDGPTRDQPSAHEATLSTAEREELVRLRAVVEQLSAPTRRRREFGWRPFVSATAIILGCILAPVAVLSAWLQSVVVDTDRPAASTARRVSRSERPLHGRGSVVLVLAALALLAVGFIEFLGTAPGEDAEPPAAVTG